MMLASSNWVLCLNWSKEISWNNLGALVNQLIKRMLAVSPWFSPDDGSSRVRDCLVGSRHVLAVGFHITLLEICSKAVHVLVIWKNSMRLRAEKVVVPDSKQAENNREILLQWCSAEVIVHVVATGKKLVEIIIADVDGNGQTDSRPERVTTSDPVPELKHVFRVNAEIGDLLCVGRERDEVLGDMCLVFCCLKEPVSCSRSIRDGLLCCECL